MIKLLFLMAISIFALNDATVPYTFTTGEKILASQFNSNFDTIETWIAKTNDSIDDKFIRFSDLNGGDSTLRVDTLYGGSSVWTGISLIDSLVVTKQIQGNIKGSVVGNVTGNVTGNITGNITGNVTGNLTGNVTGNVSGTAATVTTAAQTAITSVGTLTGLTVSGTSTFDSTRHRTITTSGNVGFGTTSPIGRVHANHSTDDMSLYLQSLATKGTQVVFYDGTAAGSVKYDHATDKLYIRGKGNNAEMMAIDNAGKVGIGTTAPAEKLDIASTGGTNVRIGNTVLGDYGRIAFHGNRVAADNTVGSVMAYNNQSGSAVLVSEIRQMHYGSSADNKSSILLSTHDGSNLNTAMYIDATQKIGFGTTAPTERLEVSGNIKADTLKGAVIGNITGNVSGTAATVTGAAQAAITSVGTLTGLTMGGNITTSTNDIITDSIFARTMTTSGNVNTGSGDVTTDSVYARTLKTSGNIQADTLKGSLSLTSLSNNGTRTIFGTSKSVVEIIRDTTLSAPGTIWLLSSPSSVTTYSGEVEVFMGMLRHARKSFSWYGGSSGISLMGDSLTLYDSNPTPFGGTVQFYSYTNGSTDNKLGINFPNISGSSAIMVYLRYTQR